MQVCHDKGNLKNTDIKMIRAKSRTKSSMTSYRLSVYIFLPSPPLLKAVGMREFHWSLPIQWCPH